MKFLLHEKRLSHSMAQRKFLVGLSGVLLLIVLLQTTLLFFKHEKIIISPPELRQSYWVEGNRFSPSYVEETALFLTHLLLDVSEASIIPQGEIILRYVWPESYGDFKKKLLADEKRLKKQQLSLHFKAKTIEFHAPLILDMQGTLLSYVGSKKISEVQETYRIGFTQRQGRLFLESFEVIQSNQEKIDETLF